MPVTTTRNGGSFAPSLPQEKLEEYKKVSAKADPRVRHAMHELITMVEEFRKTPKSKMAPEVHPTGAAFVIPLEDKERDRMFDFIPWEDELQAMGQVFERITDKEIRDAAFHLLWYGWELFRDREPITSDCVGK